MRIVVRLPNWLGDLVMATPALRAVRARFAAAHVAVLGKPHALRLLEGAPWFDEAIALTDGPLRTGLGLRGRGFTHAVLLPSSWSSAIAARVAGIPERLGYAEDGRGLLLTRALRAPVFGRLRPIPKVDHYLRLVALLGCDADESGRHLELPERPDSRARAEAWLAAHGVGPGERPIALSVGASFGPSKQWKTERWAAVAEHLLEAGHRVIVYGGPKDVPLVREVLAAIRSAGAIEATDVALGDLAAHMRRARLLISTDAGGRHIGVAVGTPTVVIMGPTHPGYSECYSDRYVVLLERPPCWPCHLRVCPIDHRCMEAVTTGAVLGAAEALLGGRWPEGLRPWRTPPGTEHALFTGAAC